MKQPVKKAYIAPSATIVTIENNCLMEGSTRDMQLYGGKEGFADAKDFGVRPWHGNFNREEW